MNKNRPKVSVLLSVHNHENYVGQAIESVLRQTFQDWELIIIDDCSQDRSPDVVRQYQDERIQFYRSEENKGAILTFNELLKKAAGEYIASLDGRADCVSGTAQGNRCVFFMGGIHRRGRRIIFLNKQGMRL